MKKNLLIMVLLCMSTMISTSKFLIAQDNKDKKLERPTKSDVKEVDEFVGKSFDAYDESLKITDDINLIKVEGDGKETPYKVTNSKGETLTKENALLQLGDLLKRAQKQNDNVKTLQDLQKPATESIKSCPMTKKPKATKSLSKGGEALNEVINQSKKQIDLLTKQISDLKTMKTAK